MNDLQIFTYEETQVRTIQQEGEPWFVLADVCRVLSLSNPSKVAERLDDDEKQLLKFGPNSDLGLNHNTTMLDFAETHKGEATTYEDYLAYLLLPRLES